MMITCYVVDHDLMLSDTAERVRRATSQERAESYAEQTGTGHIRTDVSAQTIRRACPMYTRQHLTEAIRTGLA